MAALNMTTFAYATKRLYSKEAVVDLAYKASRSPFYAKLKKWTSFTGESFTEAVTYADVAGRSAAFSVAQANKNPSLGKKFILTRSKDYALMSIDTETIMASQGDEGALLRALKREMDSATNALGRSIATALYGDGSGELGSISSISSGVITLVQADDVTNFYVGQRLVAATSSAAAPRAAVGEVTAIDRTAGTVTMDSGVDPTSWTAADELFQEGDYASAGARSKMRGLAGWIPATAESSGTFYSCDRTVDVDRLQGQRIDGSALRIDEAIFKCAVRVAREGGMPDCVFLSYGQYEELINVLGSKLEYQTTEIKAGIGFEGAKVHGPAGVLNIYPDLNAPADKAYVLDMSTWCLRSLGPAPQVLDLDGNRLSRESTADAWEARLIFMGALGCKAPGYNGVVHSLAVPS